MTFVRHVLALFSLAFWWPADAEEPPVSNADSGCGMDPLGGCRG